jgi:outer membrane receptor for ferrienterochelin and colicins
VFLYADQAHQYFERNKTFRFSTQLSFTHKIDNTSQFNFKNTIGYFDRQLDEPAFNFRGKQLSSYTEINYVKNGKKANWVTGLNLVTDHFTVPESQNDIKYDLTTIGAFVQNTYRFTRWFSLESGLRTDYNTPAPGDKPNGIFILPRVNALFKIDEHFTSRVGGGLGYKMPTLFNDETEQEGYQHLQPLNIGNTRAEQSYGTNGDINYRGVLSLALLGVAMFFLKKDKRSIA